MLNSSVTQHLKLRQSTSVLKDKIKVLILANQTYRVFRQVTGHYLELLLGEVDRLATTHGLPTASMLLSCFN